MLTKPTVVDEEPENVGGERGESFVDEDSEEDGECSPNQLVDEAPYSSTRNGSRLTSYHFQDRPPANKARTLTAILFFRNSLENPILVLAQLLVLLLLFDLVTGSKEKGHKDADNDEDNIPNFKECLNDRLLAGSGTRLNEW